MVGVIKMTDLREAVRSTMMEKALEKKRTIYSPSFGGLFDSPKEGDLKEYGNHLMSAVLGIVYQLVEVVDSHTQRILYIGVAKSDSCFHVRLTKHKKDKNFDKVYFRECPFDEMHPTETELIQQHLPPFNKCSSARKGRRILMEKINYHTHQTLNDPLNFIDND